MSWLNYFIPGKSIEKETIKKIDKVEKEIEQELPKKVNKGIKRYYLLYVLGFLLVIVLAGFFAITYAKDAKETKKNQNIMQQQIDLQKKQLDLQNKQIEDAKKNTTTTPSTTTTQPKSTTPTCDKTKQQDQINLLVGEIAKLHTAISKNESIIRDREAYLLKPEIYPGSHNDEQQGIDDLNSMNTDNNANIINQQNTLENVKKCSLMSDVVASMYRARCVTCQIGIAPFRP